MVLKITRYLFVFFIISLFNVSTLSKLQHAAAAQTIPLSIPSHFATYKNELYNYTVLYPSDWIKDDKQRNSVSFHPSNSSSTANHFYPNISIGVSTGFSKSPFMIANTLHAFKGIKIIQYTPFIYKGNTGFYLAYTAQNRILGELTVNRIILTEDKWNYDLAAAVRTDDYNKLQPTIQSIFNSLTTGYTPPPRPYALSESTGQQILNKAISESTGQQILHTLQSQTNLLQALQPQSQTPKNVSSNVQPDLLACGLHAVSVFGGAGAVTTNLSC